MMHVTLLLKDTVLIATMNAQNQWEGCCSDNLTGKSERFVWTQDQFKAVTILALSVDGLLHR